MKENRTNNSRLAIFDFDGTITYSDTLFPYLWHISTPRQFLFHMARSFFFLAGYFLGMISNEKAKSRLLQNFLKERNLEDIQKASHSFVKGRLSGLIRPGALDTIRKHQNEGDICILISASPELYVDLWAECYGFHHVFSTKIAKKGTRLSGEIDGKNCYGEEKVRRLREVVGNLNDYQITVYGDSRGDRELFEIADEGFYQPFKR